jgi:diaminopimelate epimerase
MSVKFRKYQGTGNDFIMIDNRSNQLPHDFEKSIKNLCHRRFGIGADGLIILQEKSGYDFEMIYYNSDGNQSTMCGNGGRCLVKFAAHSGIKRDRFSFLAIDGPHEAEIVEDGDVALQMKNTEIPNQIGNDFTLDTGSPHYVAFANNIKDLNVINEAQKIRYSEEFRGAGINVNFVEKVSSNEIFVRTYERGVEDETLSCGTGVVASAICFSYKSGIPMNEVFIKTLGGTLTVKFSLQGREFHNVMLIGPADYVFSGEIKY